MCILKASFILAFLFLYISVTNYNKLFNYKMILYYCGDNMILYIDLIIIMNFIVNYCFVQLISILFNERINYIRIIISSIVSVILLFSFFLNYLLYNFFKIFGGVILILISFKFINKKNLIIRICLYYLLQFSFIGILSIFNVKGCLCLVIILIIMLLFLIVFKTVKLNNETYFIDGYLDTGNLASFQNKPIIFLDKKYYKKEMIVYGVIPIKTISGIQMINCYEVESFCILIEKKKIYKDVLISFSDFENNINCLLNNLLFL